MTATQQDPGPWSSLFDYKEEEKQLEQRKQKQMEAQQKIMRTNAIGDALRLIVDSVGGSKGATITQKPVNPGILRAVERYNSLDREREAGVDRLKYAQLGAKEKDKQYQLGLEAEGRAVGRDLAKEQRTNQRQDQLINDQRKQKLEDDGRDFKQKKQLMGIESAGNIAEAKARIQAEQDALTRTVARNKMRTKADIPFIIPGTTDTVYIRPEEIQEMQYQLTKDKEKYDPELDAALKALLANETVKDAATINVLKKNWDKIKYVLPEYAGMKPPKPTALEKRKSVYDKELEKINTNPALRARQRVKAIKRLNDQYQDIFETDNTTVIQPDAKGVTDVSQFFN